MYAVTPEFKAKVRQPHAASVRAEIWRSGVFLRALDVIDGSVDIDSRRSQRRTCSLTVPATKPTVRLLPEFLTYQAIRGAIVTWDASTPTWDTVGVFTWDQGNSVASTLDVPTFPTYADLSTGYESYGAIREITGYTEETVDDGLIPTSPFSDVSPFGNELRLWRGVEVERPLFRTYESIAGIRMTWDLVSASLTWATVDSLLTWADGNDVPI
jgi:hypothetical protein